MRRFITTSALLCAALLLTLALGEYAVRQIPNPYRTKNEQMLRRAEEIETIFLGSSHAYYAIRPEFIPHSFNLANTSQTLKYDYFMLQHYGGMCRRLKTVVLPVSYFTFFAHGFEDSDLWWYAINYKVYMDCDYHSDFSKYNLELSHPAVFRGKLKSKLFKTANNSCDSLGWGTNHALKDRVPSWETTDAVSAAKRHTTDWSHLEENLSDFRKIASFCKARGVRLVLLTTPAWHSYREHLDKRQLAKMYELVRRMQSEYDLPYFDYMNDARFTAHDFYDADHLNEFGAKKFSLIVQEEILSPRN